MVLGWVYGDCLEGVWKVFGVIVGTLWVSMVIVFTQRTTGRRKIPCV